MLPNLLLLVIAFHVEAIIKDKDCRDSNAYSPDIYANDRERGRIKLLLFNDVEPKKYVCRLETEAARIRNTLKGINYDKKVLQKYAEKALLIKPKTDLNVTVVTESKLQYLDSIASAAGCASGESKLEQPASTTRTTTTTTTPRPTQPRPKPKKKAKRKTKKKGRKQGKRKATQKKKQRKAKAPPKVVKIVESSTKPEKNEVQQSPKVTTMIKYYVCVYKSRGALEKKAQ
ncbi:unnamed protein product [Cylicostephanus goldi]|uniref:Uncharacterized protein n=1 Tax=Cylicostephanus goldi TaxID=71465 RepID=A0A3P7NBC1_CYLGO|nr:unnamed protein product [Cylicostephanus goldi]